MRDGLSVRTASWPAPRVLAGLAATVGLLLPLVVAVHYLSAAIAVRAVSDPRLSLGRTTLVQLAAAATDRLIPNGLGGFAINMRYLLRAGQAPGAVSSSLAELAVVGGVTDAAYTAAVTTMGPALGLSGGASELRALTARGLTTGQQYPAVLVVGVVALLLVMRRRRWGLGAVMVATRAALVHAQALMRQPGRLLVAASASAATTVVLSLGLVASVVVWGQSTSPMPAGVLVSIYLVMAAVGGTTPLPAFFLVTEAGLVSALVLAGYTPVSALSSVVIFRAVTSWLPMPVGLAAARWLRRAEVL